MAVIKVENDGISFEIKEGGRLMDVIEKQESTIMFGCRNAGCGICHINVKEGFDNLGEISAEEQQLLDVMGEHEHDRLCCQVKVFGDAVIEIMN